MDNIKVFMEPISHDFVVDTIEGRQTRTTTGMSSARLIEVDANTVAKLKQSVLDIGNAFNDVILADEVELEFSFGITGNGNICILSGSSSLGIKVTLKWNKNENTTD